MTTAPANIGPREIARRRRLGVAALIAGMAWVALAGLRNFPAAAHGVTFFCFFSAALGLLQARGKT